MSHEHENAVVPESKHYAPPQRVHYKGAGNDQALLDDPQQAFNAIETFANGGKGDASQIVHIAFAPWRFHAPMPPLDLTTVNFPGTATR